MTQTQITIPGIGTIAKETISLSNAQKRDKNINQILQIISRPIIVMPGYEDLKIPEDIKSQIMTERMILGMQKIETATDTETMWYLSSASLIAPLDHEWTQYYMHLFRLWCDKTNRELPDFVADEISLSEYEQSQLNRLKDWLYKKSIQSFKERMRQGIITNHQMMQGLTQMIMKTHYMFRPHVI